MTLFYNGGNGVYNIEKRLAPGEQIWADVGRIIREQIPDRDGHTIPPTVTSGSSELWDLDHPGLGHVFEGKLVLDKTYGRAFYGCNICCRQYGAALHVTPFSGPVGSGDYDTVTYRECDGTEYDGTWMAYGWYSYNTSIATLPDRYLSLVGVGSTTTKAKIDLITSRCQPYTDQPQQSVTSNPMISGPNTVWWFNGESPAGYATVVTLTSSGGAATTWSVTAGADKITLSATSGSQVTVRSSGTTFSSSPGDISVVATANLQSSAPFTMTTRKPYQLAVPVIQHFCDSLFGYRDAISYEIRDQLGAIVPFAVDWNEQFTSSCFQDNVQGNWCSYGLPTQVGASGTILVDYISGPGVNNAPPPNPMPVCVGDSTQQQHWGQQFRIGSPGVGFGVRVQTDNIVRFMNHAEHQNVVSPVP